MSDIDLNALAASLADTAASLDEHIAKRAQEIAEPQIRQAAERAQAARDEQAADLAAFDQRLDNLRAEFKRQLAARDRDVERLGREVKATRGAVRRVELLQVWTNEDRRQFVFAEVSSYGPAALLAASPDAATDA